MNCHLCQCPYDSIQHVFDHLTIHHSTPTTFKYTCTACVPSALFQNLHRFKRHVKAKHSNLFQPIDADRTSQHPAVNNTAPNSIDPDIDAEDNVHHNLSSTNIDEAPNENELEEKNVDGTLGDAEILDIRNSLRENFLNFSLGLHNKHNYTRKDVINLQQCITDEIVKPICDALLKIAPINNTAIGIDDLVNDIYHPFEFIATEQKLNTTLQNLNLNDSLHVINFTDEDKNVVSKGCLMPIKQQFKRFFESGNVFNETIENMRLL